MTRKTMASVRITSLAAAGMMIAALAGSVGAAGAHVDEPPGLDPVAQAAMLADHFAREHAADLAPPTELDPVARAAMLADHFAREHRGDN